MPAYRGIARRLLMRRAVRGIRGKAVGLALVVALAVGSLALAATGFPLLPERPAAAEGPDQRWGSAEGLGHFAGGPANTRPPTSLRATYPTGAPKAAARPSGPPNTAEVSDPPASRVTGFDAATSTEIAAERDALSRTYANQDGTRTTEISTTPINYLNGKGSWQHIDTTLTDAEPDGSAPAARRAGRGEGWTTTADSVALTLAPRADSPRLALLTLPSGASFGYRLDGAAAAPGNARGTASVTRTSCRTPTSGSTPRRAASRRPWSCAPPTHPPTSPSRSP